MCCITVWTVYSSEDWVRIWPQDPILFIVTTHANFKKLN